MDLLIYFIGLLANQPMDLLIDTIDILAILQTYLQTLWTYLQALCVATPLWVKWEDETSTPKVGDWESSGTPECLEFNSKVENTSHWGVLGVIGKFLKRRYRKWPCIGHLDICSPSYGQKKGRESNWQFDSRSLEVKNRPPSDLRIESATWR